MASKTEIYNLALLHIGGGATITSPEEDSEAARALNAAWDLSRRATLRAHPWNVAIRRAGLAASATAPSWGYARAFDIPADPVCLKVLEVDSDLAWRLEGGQILTDEAAPLRIRYVADLADAGELDDTLAQALALKLAATACYRLTRDGALAQALEKRFTDYLAEARSVDAQEGTPDEPAESLFILDRSL